MNQVQQYVEHGTRPRYEPLCTLITGDLYAAVLESDRTFHDLMRPVWLYLFRNAAGMAVGSPGCLEKWEKVGGRPLKAV